MRERVGELLVKWRKRGYELDFGVGIAQGYATIGAIGFEGRWDYGAIGTVTNLAARLCGEAQPGQILISQRVLGAVEELVEVEHVGGLALKGFSRPLRLRRAPAKGGMTSRGERIPRGRTSARSASFATNRAASETEAGRLNRGRGVASHRRVAAIDEQHGARHVRCLLGGQEQDAGGHFLKVRPGRLDTVLAPASSRYCSRVLPAASVRRS